MIKSLRFRIMAPAIVFILIFSVLFILLNNYYTSRLLDTRLEREAVRISKILYESRFVLNPVYLKRLGKVIEGKIAVFDAKDNIIAASFDKAEVSAFLSHVNPKEIRTEISLDNHEQVILKINQNQGSSLLVAKKLFFYDTKKSILIVILTPMDDLKAAKSNAALRTLLYGSLALLIAFAAAGLVLKKITSSFKDILNVTEKIASGDFNCKLELPEIRELKILALSINQMSDKLMEYEKQLIDSTRFRSANKITAAMAHEIKNPLSSMKMLAQIIQKNLQHDPEGLEMTNAFIKEINRIDSLVSDLGSLSGPGRFSFAMTYPVLPLEEMLILIKPKMDHLNIKIEPIIEPDLPKISMDRDKIKQVLWNLMINAGESMIQGGEITVCLKKSDQTKSIEYIIQDRGIGINKKNIDNIFTPFFTTKKEGIGIGLYVSREIALAHKGKLNIISKTPGTRAVLSIPCNKINKGAL